MYKRILVPLDQSQCAEAILPHVEELAQCLGAEVIFLQVVDFDPTLTMASPYDLVADADPALMERRIAEVEDYLNDWQRTFQTRGIQASVRVEYGAVVPTIMAISEQEKVDLVAMASHGRSGLSRFFYGSVAAGVMQRIDRPLLVVRSE